MVTCACGSPIASCVMHPGNTGTPTGQFVDDAVWNAVLANIRRPVNGDTVNGTVVLTFVPVLTTAEQATLADIIAMTAGHITGLSLAEYQALKPKLAEIRPFRTRTLATWNGLTTTAREADEIGYLNDLADVLRALLRDG